MYNMNNEIRRYKILIKAENLITTYKNGFVLLRNLNLNVPKGYTFNIVLLEKI